MAETRTALLQLPQWSSGQTDSPSRDDFNQAFANIEKWAPRFEYGALADRPAPELAGRYYVDDTGVIYRDSGTQWRQVGLPKNSLKVTKTEGADPAMWADVPTALGSDAFRSTHDSKTRFRVSAIGDVIGSSTRLYQSDTLPPANTLPHTVGIATKAANASGVTIYGQSAQSGNLVETKTTSGADLTQLTPSGDVNTLGRLQAGVLQAQDAQLFVQGSGTTRPTAMFRTNSPTPNNNTALAIEMQGGTSRLLGVSNAGQMTFGDRNSKEYVAGDNVAWNSNYTSANGGTNPIERGRLVFRNTAQGYGVAGLSLRQEPGDAAAGGSLVLFAGTSDTNGVAPERLRLGVTPDKHGARLTADLPDWTPLVVRGAQSQSADLVLLQDAGLNTLARIGPRGDAIMRSLAVTSDTPNNFGGAVTSADTLQGTALKLIQGSKADAGILSQIRANATAGAHLTAQDDTGAKKARINRDGTLEIGMDTNAVAADAVLLTMRGQQYRQSGRKLQSFDQNVGRWSTFVSAMSAEYYTQTVQNVKNAWTPIQWFGEVNDTENLFGFTSGSPVITVPFTGLYDVRALAHCYMNFTGSGSATFRVNGNLELKYRRDYAKALGFDVVTLSLNDMLLLNAGDTLEFMIQIDSFFFTANTLNTGDYRSRCSIRFAGYA